MIMAARPHPIGSAMPSLPRLLSRVATAAAIASCAMALAAEALPTAPTSPIATRIAAALIAERAREQALAGAGAIASQLDALARALNGGQVTLADAALVMHIAMAGAPPPPHGQAASAPRVSPEQVVAILDGSAAATAPIPAPPAPAAGAPAAATAPPPPPPPAPHRGCRSPACWRSAAAATARPHW